MLKFFSRGVAATAIVAFSSFVSIAQAHDARAGDLVLKHPHSNATVGVTRPGVVYVTIVNNGKRDDALVSAESPVAGHVELHRSLIEGGVVKMRPVKEIVVPSGGQVALKRGGYHLMLMGLKRPLKAGETYSLILRFRHAGTVTARVRVDPLRGKAPAMKGMEHHMH